MKKEILEKPIPLQKAKLKLPMSNGEDFDLSEYKGKKVVLFFYPRDMTPGCTQESIEFSKLKKDFAKNNAVVLGVSRDSVASHEKFINKEKLTVDLISDAEEKACKLFGVIKEKNMYGKKVMGIERSTFVFSKDHDLAKAWRKVKVEGHAHEVLDFVKNLD